MVSALAHRALMEMSPGNTQPESFMRRTSTNASPLPSRPGLRDTAGVRDGTHVLAVSKAGTCPSPCGDRPGCLWGGLSSQRSSSVSFLAAHRGRGGKSRGGDHTQRWLSLPVRGQNRTGTSILGSQCCKSHPKTGTFGDISQG